MSLDLNIEQIRQLSPEVLLPQRNPFVFIDGLVLINEKETITHFLVKEDCLFIENRCLSQAGITENIAQTCAARIGYYNYINQKDIRIGVIGAIRNLEFRRLPKVGEHIHTKITVQQEVFGMTLVEAECKIENETIATCMMKIALR